MPAGRPTKYNAELQAKADDYLVNYDTYGDVIPSEAGLADVIGVCRDTVIEWGKDKTKPQFSDTLRQIRNKQERVAVNQGLKGEFNAAITKLILHNHGYSDKTETKNEHDHSGYVGSGPITDDQLEAIARGRG